MMNKNCVVTGCGIVSSIGVGKEAFWTSLVERRSNVIPNPVFADDKDAPLMGKVFLPVEAMEIVSQRIQRKIDRFTLLSFIAQDEALKESGLKLAYPSDKIGIILGNTFGGWGFVENQLHDLYHVGYETLNPYVATAWFPTASQGEISIFYGINGYSKTIAADYLSAAYGMIHAIDLIKSNQLQGCLVGGVEAPLTALIYNACKRLGLIDSEKNEPSLSEAAGIFAIETEVNARERGASILGCIEGIGSGSSYEAAMRRCLMDGCSDGSDVDYLLLDSQSGENSEARAISEVWTETGSSPEQRYIKHLYGNVFSADFALQIIAAILLLKHSSKQDGKTKVLINGSNLSRQYFSLLLSKS